MRQPDSRQQPKRRNERSGRAADADYCAASERRWVRIIARAMAALLLCQATVLAVPAQAQITPGTGAAAGRRPIMDAARNGVPIVHIAPPSAAGVSHNQYKQFNVDANGLILNNSGAEIQSRQGGWISGNLQLGPLPARIILNEVTGANQSALRGTIEVAGRRADIVVANPNGIGCDGCGFFNTSRASLVTGQPQFNGDGMVTGFDVRGGQLQVGASGLNAAGLEQLDLIARGMVFDGEVWAGNLNVIAGANQVLYGTLHVATQPGSGPAPPFAIDIRDLGGMHAKQIYLLSSERGVGVNSTGRMAALQGNLPLSAGGDLSVKDSHASHEIRVNGAGNVTLTGHTRSGATATVTAAGTLTNTGAIDAATRLDLQGGMIANAGTVIQHDSAGATLSASGQITNSGRIHSAGVLEIGGSEVTDRNGMLQSAGELRLKAGTVNLAGTQMTSDAGIRTMATGGRLVAIGTRVRAAELNVSAVAALDTRGSDWQTTGTADLRGASVANRGGTVLANGRLTIDIGAQALVNIASGSTGGIVAGGTLIVNAESLDNRAGFIGSKDSQVLTLAGDLDNRAMNDQKGQIASNAGSTIRAGRVFNQGSRIDALGAIGITAGLLDNSGGAIAGNGAVRLDVATLGNRALDGTAATIDGAGITATTSTIDNHGGVMRASGDTTLSAASLDNTGGSLGAAGMLRVTSTSVVNDAGSIVGDGGVIVTTGSQSPGGAIASQHDVTLNIQGDYLNTGLLSGK